MKYWLATFSIFFVLSAYSQQEESFSDRLFWGGDVVLSFNSFGLVAGASPLVGYRITDAWSAGVGTGVLYTQATVGAQRYTHLVYGANVFSRLMIIENIFAQSEFHLANTEVNYYDPINDVIINQREWVPIWYVGGGFRQPLGARSFASLTVLWDILDDRRSPYINPMIRGGVTFGF